MTVLVDIDEPQRETFVHFLKTLPYIMVLSEEPIAESNDWNEQTTQQFLTGYTDADAIYDDL